MTVISLIWNQKEQGFGNAGDPGSIPVSGRSPREGNGNHSSTLAWKIPWMEEPHRLQFMGLQSWTQLSDFAFAFLVSPWGSYLRGAQREGPGRWKTVHHRLPGSYIRSAHLLWLCRLLFRAEAWWHVRLHQFKPTPPRPPLHTGLLAKTLDAEAAIPWNSLLSSRSYLIVKW